MNAAKGFSRTLKQESVEKDISGSEPIIYIYAPAYIDKSNGIKILYSLGALINDAGGFKAKMLCYERPRNDFGTFSGCEVIYLHYRKPEFRACDVVIYPETIAGNPTGAHRVVRYLMNKPYFLTGVGVDYGSKDLLISYSNGIDALHRTLFIMHDERNLYLREQKEKKNNAVIYFGKVDPVNLDEQFALVRSLIPSFDKVECITRLHPSQKSDLLDLIGESRLMMSFDPLTNLNYESTLCGTPVLMLNDDFNLLDGSFNLPMHGIFSSMQGYHKAVEDVGLSYVDYCKRLDEQPKHVAEICEGIFCHFERVLIDPEYAATVSKRNEAQKAKDEMNYLGRDSSTLVNIDYLQQIPTCYKEVFGIRKSMHYATSRPSCQSELGRPFHSRLYLKVKRNVIEPLGFEGIYTILFRLHDESFIQRMNLARERYARNISAFREGINDTNDQKIL